MRLADSAWPIRSSGHGVLETSIARRYFRRLARLRDPVLPLTVGVLHEIVDRLAGRLDTERFRQARVHQDTGAACRLRASSDLLKSAAALTANQQLLLQRSAESWTLRAAMLERMEKSFEKRRALDEASHNYEIEHAGS